MAVNEIAILRSKNIAKTGIRRVPSPKPEKRVRKDIKIAEKQIIKNSILT
jgi:hypothetical protein